MRFLSYFCLVVMLAGCTSIWNPSPFPAGYTYHHNEIKSPPGPDARDIGYDYSYAKNELIQHKWIEATRDLVAHLEQQTGLAPQIIHISDVLEPTAFNQTFDHALRYAFRERGYTLVSGADAFPARLTYEAIPIDKSSPIHVPLVQSYKDVAPYNLILQLYTGAPEPTSVGKIYQIPAYGYSKNGHKVRKKKEESVDSTRTNNFEVLGGENN